MHVARAHDEIDTAIHEPGGHCGIAVVPVGVVVELEDRRRDPGRACALERVRLGAVRRDRSHGQAGIEERLEVRPLTADEDADHAETIRPTTRPSVPGGTTAR